MKKALLLAVLLISLVSSTALASSGDRGVISNDTPDTPITILSSGDRG
ncbi:hypothetical protein [Brevibacillus fulvus]|uniref:Uncharacterized protein n=1 Tax=Brevibacillus fulvus TaxID=1125967 RepID=A0A939BNI5_9BACL|nr:hypothetical protein [Brevibacillus fulvus]MBM7589095.1 hypothetical protein [Brevibacillus fulvus]